MADNQVPSIYTEIRVDVDKLRSDLAKADKEVKAFAASMGKINTGSSRASSSAATKHAKDEAKEKEKIAKQSAAAKVKEEKAALAEIEKAGKAASKAKLDEQKALASARGQLAKQTAKDFADIEKIILGNVKQSQTQQVAAAKTASQQVQASYTATAQKQASSAKTASAETQKTWATSTSAVRKDFEQVSSTATTHFNKVEKEASKSAGALSKAFSGAGSMLSTALGVFTGGAGLNILSSLTSGISSVISKGVEFDDSLQRTQIRLQAMGGDVRGTAEELEALKKLSVDRGFDFTVLGESAVKFKAVNYSIKDTQTLLKGAADATVAFAGGDEMLNKISTAFEIMADKEELAGRQLMALERSGIPALKVLSEETGLSVKQLEKLSKAGALKGDVAARLLSEGFTRRYGTAADLVSRQSFSVSEARFGAQLAQTGGTAIAPGLREGTLGLNAAIGAMQSQGGQKLAAGIGSASETLFGGINKSLGFIAGGDFAGFGKYAVEQMGAGMKSALGFIGDIGKDIGKSIADSVKSALGIQSPSKVFEEIGVMSAQGFILGYQKTIQDAGLGNITTSDFTPAELALQKTYGKQTPDIAERARRYRSTISAASSQFGISPDLLTFILGQESQFNPLARSPKSAAGIAQFTAGTFKRYGTANANDRFSPDLAIPAAAHYLSHLSKMFGGDPDLIAAAYNSGEGRVARAGNQVPNLRETQGYVRNLHRFQANLSQAPGAPSRSWLASHAAQLKAMGLDVPPGISPGGNEPMPGGPPGVSGPLNLGSIQSGNDIYLGVLKDHEKENEKAITEMWNADKQGAISASEQAKNRLALLQDTEKDIDRITISWKKSADTFEAGFGRFFSAAAQGQNPAKAFLKDVVGSFQETGSKVAAAKLRDFIFGSPQENEAGIGLFGKNRGKGSGRGLLGRFFNSREGKAADPQVAAVDQNTNATVENTAALNSFTGMLSGASGGSGPPTTRPRTVGGGSVSAGSFGGGGGFSENIPGGRGTSAALKQGIGFATSQTGKKLLGGAFSKIGNLLHIGGKKGASGSDPYDLPINNDRYMNSDDSDSGGKSALGLNAASIGMGIAQKFTQTGTGLDIFTGGEMAAGQAIGGPIGLALQGNALLIGGIARLLGFGGGDLKKLKDAVYSRWHIKVKSGSLGDKLAESLQQQAQGNPALTPLKKHIMDAVSTGSAKQLIEAYAEQTGQDDNILVKTKVGTDPNSAANFIARGIPGRASGGDVIAGAPYAIFDTPKREVFVPSSSGHIYPDAREFFGNGQGDRGVPIEHFQALLDSHTELFSKVEMIVNSFQEMDPNAVFRRVNPSLVASKTNQGYYDTPAHWNDLMRKKGL